MLPFFLETVSFASSWFGCSHVRHHIPKATSQAGGRAGVKTQTGMALLPHFRRPGLPLNYTGEEERSLLEMQPLNLDLSVTFPFSSFLPYDHRSLF